MAQYAVSKQLEEGGEWLAPVPPWIPRCYWTVKSQSAHLSRAHLVGVIGVGGGSLLVAWSTKRELSAVVGDGLALTGLLLGLVFAAFSLLIALFSDDYIRLLSKAEDGVEAFLRPLLIAIGLQVTAIVVAIGYRAANPHMTYVVAAALFLVWAFLFSFVLVDIVALARNVTLDGLTARDLAMTSAPEASNVHPIEGKRRAIRGSG